LEALGEVIWALATEIIDLNSATRVRAGVEDEGRFLAFGKGRHDLLRGVGTNFLVDATECVGA